MKLKITQLRRAIRKVLLEAYEAEEEAYEDTVIPGEAADEELLAEPDLTDQEHRDDYLKSKADRSSKKKKARLNSREETDEDMGDEHSVVGGGGIRGHMGGAWGPPKKQKKIKSKNAMTPKSLDEYDE